MTPDLPTKWLPLSFCGEMTLAVREGRKSMTRRVITPQPKGYGNCWATWLEHGDIYFDATYKELRRAVFTKGLPTSTQVTPRYPVGTGLYFAEATYACVSPECDGGLGTVWKADNTWSAKAWIKDNGKPYKVNTLAPRFMRRCLCRTLGVVTAVKAERVGDITEEDAKAEGVALIGNGRIYAQGDHPGHLVGLPQLIVDFADLWDSLHGEKPGERWADSPWVWTYTFRRLTTDHQEAQAILARSET